MDCLYGSPYRSRNNYRGGETQNGTNETQNAIFETVSKNKQKEAQIEPLLRRSAWTYFFFDEIAIFFGSGSGVSGTLTFRTPSSRCASILSASALFGSAMRR